MKNAPQLFHNKHDQDPHASYSFELLKGLNNSLSGNELKIMLVYLGCKGDGSFSPSTEYMLQMTGIKSSTHYFAARRKLIKKGYLRIQDKEIIVDVNKICPNPKS